MKVIKFKIFALAIIFTATNLQAQNFPFEVKNYFAYIKIPDKKQSGLQIFSPYIFLSNEKCMAQGMDQRDAKQSIAYWTNGQIQQNCWAEYRENVITCPIAGNEKNGKVGNACIDIGKNRFLDISNIPKQANFASDTFTNKDNSVTQECKTLYQAYSFNNFLENICKFNSGVARNIGIEAKNVCRDMLPENIRKKFSDEVKNDVQKDIERMGKTQFCFENRKAYNNLNNIEIK